MIRLLVTIFLLSLLTVTFGQSVKTFTWTPPQFYTNGEPLPDSEIDAYRIYCNGSLLAEVDNTGGTDTYVSGLLPAGDYACTARTVATNGTESDDSGVANFTVDLSRPEAPSGFSVILP